MKLIDLYVHEVTRRLPAKTQEDIALELQSTIEDMLPEEGCTEQDVKAALTTLGNPAILARRYRDRPSYLIGPDLYETYLTVIKLVMPIALTILLITLVAEELIHYTGDTHVLSIVVSLFVQSIVSSVGTAIHVFFWVTISFIVIERSVPIENIPQALSNKKWTPDQLKNKPIIPKKRAISKWEIFFSLLWTAIWASVYFNASNLIAIYNTSPDQERLHYVASIFNEDVLRSYWPFVILFIVIEIALAVYKWISKQWTNKLAFTNLVFHLLFIILFTVFVNDVDLFNPEAMSILSEVPETDLPNLKQWFQITAIISLTIYAGIDSFEGFRKANNGMKKGPIS